MAASKRDALVRRFVNKTEGSERAGQKFKVVTKGGVRYHDYGGGRLIADKAGLAKKAAPAAPTAPAQQGIGTAAGPVSGGTPAPAAAPATDRAALRAKATGTGSQLNVAAASPRIGQRFNVVTEGGTRYHDYGSGRKFADVKRGTGTARYRKRKPTAPLPAGARTSGFGSTSWSQR